MRVHITAVTACVVRKLDFTYATWLPEEKEQIIREEKKNERGIGYVCSAMSVTVSASGERRHSVMRRVEGGSGGMYTETER